MAETMGWLGMIGLGAAAMGGMGYLANGRWTGVVGMGAMGAAFAALSYFVIPATPCP